MKNCIRSVLEMNHTYLQLASGKKVGRTHRLQLASATKQPCTLLQPAQLTEPVSTKFPTYIDRSKAASSHGAEQANNSHVYTHHHGHSGATHQLVGGLQTSCNNSFKRRSGEPPLNPLKLAARPIRKTSCDTTSVVHSWLKT
jgi:hypothetical protein